MKPAQAVSGADLQSRSASSGSAAVSCFHLLCARCLKTLFCLFVCSETPDGESGGIFFLAEITTWPQMTPSLGILYRV